MAARIVTARFVNDLECFDMVDMGVFIHTLHLWPSGWVVARCWIEEHDVGGGRTYKAPRWGEPIDKPMVFPMIIVRGVEPPPWTEVDSRPEALLATAMSDAEEERLGLK